MLQQSSVHTTHRRGSGGHPATEKGPRLKGMYMTRVMRGGWQCLSGYSRQHRDVLWVTMPPIYDAIVWSRQCTGGLLPDEATMPSANIGRIQIGEAASFDG